MPRGGGSRGGSRGRSSSPQPPPRQTQAPTRPMPQQTQPQTQSGGGMFSGIGSTIMTGMAFGAGSEVAHQAVRSVMGGGSHGQTEQHQQQEQQAPLQQYQQPCQMEMDNFSKCLSTNDNINYCQNFSDMLKNCKQANHLAWSDPIKSYLNQLKSSIKHLSSILHVILDLLELFYHSHALFNRLLDSVLDLGWRTIQIATGYLSWVTGIWWTRNP